MITVAGAGVRRRSRQCVCRSKAVQFSLTQEEFDAISSAAAQAGLARGAYAAGVTLASARGAEAREVSPLREALAGTMSAAGLARRIGTNLNQVVARLNATGQRSEDLISAAEFCARVVRRLDDVAEHVRRRIP